ncbi:hypothetical protein PHLGIDRAFT_20061 [Phlebiopsis gigantea 11061_1 CR5-6]|uniref:Uncharacterized protein n=1 Tax=Phlebiopsis gigantea (strain 11061_1 CR5-6) TaxID=745531 RepID=A0A0C3NH58_PHLG1|nr:hypothetical protein PHLGIDRAFT_20061 [Phlebiopsis gigantea 11061_1 CR5-6]
MANSESDPNGLNIKWTSPAEEEVEKMAGQQRFQGINVKKWHEDKVRMYGQEQVPHATKARIRKPAHAGGTVATEAEHITVTFKEGNQDLGAHHIYTHDR